MTQAPAATTDRSPTRPWYALPHPVTGERQGRLPASTIDRLRDPIPGDVVNAWLIGAVLTLFAFVVRVVNLGFPKNMVFDEIYYAKDGWALWNFGHERDWNEGSDVLFAAGDYSGVKESGSFIVHPPLGKWLIGLGEQVFGPGSFGWRFMPLVAGTLLVLVVFFLARRLARSTLVGAMAALLLSVDGLHFVMSRIALLDIFQSLFTLLAVLLLVVDRDWFRAKLADHLAAKGIPDLQGRFGPRLLWRPWRLAAGVAFGLAVATKWNSIYAVATFSLLSVAWDVGARRLAGAGRTQWKSLLVDAPMAFVYHVVVMVLVYLASWWGWLGSSGSYARDFAANNPDATSVRLLGGPLASLLDYHRQMFEFHTGDGMKQATHPYEAHPAGWLFVARSIGIDAINDIKPGQDGCPPGGENCLRVIDGIGTPLLWWGGIFALIAALVLWIGNRDWRFAVPVVGVATFWLTWFPNADRPLFFFYAIMIIPFTVIAVALCLGKVLGNADSPRRRAGAIVVGVFLALVTLNFAYLYPVLSDGILTHSQWQARMWLKSWI
ncbi:phospholipid carrier-dependent glycosyltransferase [Mariniluteicoccus flavus]